MAEGFQTFATMVSGWAK